MLWWRKIEGAGKAPKDESGAAADDKYRYLPNYYKVKGSEHFADSSSSMVECKLLAMCSYFLAYLLTPKPLLRKEKESRENEEKRKGGVYIILHTFL